MAKNRKNHATAIRFGPVLKVVVVCSIICGSAIGYVWQKGEIGRLERQIAERTKRFDQLKNDNIRLQNQISQLHSVGMIDLRVRELKLGLGPVQPQQMVLLVEPPAPATGANKNNLRQFARRSADTLTPWEK